MRKRNWIIFGFIFLIGFGVFNTSFLSQLWATGENLYIKMQIFNLILNELQKSYVEEVDPIELIEDAIKGMLSNLDPHTAYLPREQFMAWHEKFDGFSGIGIYFDIVRDEVTVTSVIENGPAYKAGILPNDKIVAINYESTDGLKHDQVAKILKGVSGTTLTLTVQRGGLIKPKLFKVIRERILINSISDAYMIDNEVGYVRLAKFTVSTRNELHNALTKLSGEGMKKCIIDLRDNGGGLMQASIDVADLFLPDKRKIVYKKGRSEESYEAYFSSGKAPFADLPLILLINHATASAAEIVAGAFQDWDRALIIGEPSFGKGLVQSQIRFADNSALLLTTAKYYTPSGRLIQRDYHAKTRDEYYREAYNDSLRIELMPKSQEQTFKTLQGRPIFGGGGIIPDINIKSEQKDISPLIKEIYYYAKTEKPILALFAEDYIRDNGNDFLKKELPEKKNIARFLDKFTFSEKMVNQFEKLLKENQFPISRTQIYANLSDLEFLLKREIAYRIWGEYGRFRVKLLYDKQLRTTMNYFPETQKLLNASLMLYEDEED